MADTKFIELVIKIPEENYDDILNGETKASALNWSTFNAIRNGTMLPKGHGRLGDLDALEVLMKDEVLRHDLNEYGCLDLVHRALIIIKADEGDNE